ncbi:MAG: diguanylate cyclase [Rhodocyclaceae bacterium]|nr:MAG: diguanylate cyclase [Rhodocyclaceae bacterium]
MPTSPISIDLQGSAKGKVEALAFTLGKAKCDIVADILNLFLNNVGNLPAEGIACLLENGTPEAMHSSWWYRELADNAPVLIWVSGLDKGCVFFNKPWQDFTGRPLTALLGNGWADDVHPDDAQRCMKVYRAAFDARECFDVEYRLRRHDGEYRWMIDTAAPHFNDAGEFQGYIGSCIDITPRKHKESQLQLAETSIELLDDGVIITDPEHCIVWVNPAFTKITGYPLEDVKGKKPSVLSSGKHDEAFYLHMFDKLRVDGRWQGEIWNRRKNGEVYPEWLSINSVKDDHGVVVNYVGIFSDITRQKAKEENSRYLSTHDPLTGLANRYLMEQVLEFAILSAKRSKKGLAVLFIDLDGFKLVNDTFGHLVGDDLLKDVAQSITGSIRESDLAARPGGDEFVVVLENLCSIRDAEDVARKISKPIRLEFDPTVCVTFSIGISYYDGVEETNAKTLIHLADKAMYQAKESGKNAIKLASEAV